MTEEQKIAEAENLVEEIEAHNVALQQFHADNFFITKTPELQYHLNKLHEFVARLERLIENPTIN